MTGRLDVDVSLVSHGHGALVVTALEALALSLSGQSPAVRVWLTVNLPEPGLEQAVQHRNWPFEVHWIRNTVPKGFGANHNQAFARAQVAGAGRWFIVMNPDIFWPATAHNFWSGLQQDGWSAHVGLVCPLQVDADGEPQDFARRLMTPWGLAQRVLYRLLGWRPSGVAKSVAIADWVNGACMVWRSQAFAALRGFDEGYYMYCEDTDICLRLQLAGWRMQDADLKVVHDARRNTGRSWQHLGWHLRSMIRLWCSRPFWSYRLRPAKSF